MVNVKTLSDITLTQKTNMNEMLLESYKASERIQNIKIEELEKGVNHLNNTLFIERNSLSWRITYPLRILKRIVRKNLTSKREINHIIKQIYRIYKSDGVVVLYKKIVKKFSKKEIFKISNKNEKIYLSNINKKYLEILEPHILIIAELSLRQCAKYRVWQKKEALESLGWTVSVVDWRDKKDSLALLQVCTQVVFYRTPAFNSVKDLIIEAKRLGLSPWWEVDDLIFSREYYLENNNLITLSKREREEVLWGAELFKECLTLCGRGIASTHQLANVMRSMGLTDVRIIENSFDKNTLLIADSIIKGTIRPDHDENEIRIVYGSGTKTHDADFKIAAQGLVNAMLADHRITLRVVGDLTLPVECDVVRSRITCMPECDYATYMQILSNADITIAPLEKSIFNDCKSNIKFLEGAVFSIPIVCSPADAFKRIIQQGENGFLAHTEHEWTQTILWLAQSSALRCKVGKRAQKFALNFYHQDTMTQRQILPVFGLPNSEKKDDFSILSVNIYFSPNSFGGATFVADEMENYFSQQKKIKFSVFTSRPEIREREQVGVRYQVGRSAIMAVETDSAPYSGYLAGLDNPRVTENFRIWLKAVKPNVVHFHSIIGLGIGLTRACMENHIPYVITLHDAWWLCERNYMVNGQGKFCGQRKIDLIQCQICMPESKHLKERAQLMQIALDNAALLLAPSESHRQLYIDNGVSPEKIVVNKNGFVWPKKNRPARKATQPLRFGYVSGEEIVKGYNLLREVFEKIDGYEWELMLVDNKKSLGIESLFTGGWKTKGRVKILPAYTQETMDDFYDAIDVLVFPSQCKESYGLSVREALARDVWVIATNGGGQVEDIVDGENGTIIAADGTSIELEKAVLDLLKNTDKFINYKNNYKYKLTTFKRQAEELEVILRQSAYSHKYGTLHVAHAGQGELSLSCSV